MTHLAQMRIVNERNYVYYTKNTGLLSSFFNSTEKEARKYCEQLIEYVWDCAKKLDLELSPELEGIGSM